MKLFDNRGKVDPPRPVPPPPKMKTQITYQQVLDRANILYRNKVEETFKKKYPDLDMNVVQVVMEPAAQSMLEALIEIINENK